MAISGVGIEAALADREKAIAPASKAAGAAKQFEALLIAQMLKQMHAGGDDASMQTAMEYAQEQFARVISDGGGFGLAKVIERGLAG